MVVSSSKAMVKQQQCSSHWSSKSKLKSSGNLQKTENENNDRSQSKKTEISQPNSTMELKNKESNDVELDVSGKALTFVEEPKIHCLYSRIEAVAIEELREAKPSR